VEKKARCDVAGGAPGSLNGGQLPPSLAAPSWVVYDQLLMYQAMLVAQFGGESAESTRPGSHALCVSSVSSRVAAAARDNQAGAERAHGGRGGRGGRRAAQVGAAANGRQAAVRVRSRRVDLLAFDEWRACSA